MLEAGVLDKVDAIFGLHVSSSYPFGMAISKPGPILAASGFFEAVIGGKGGHAALPQHTIDPILAASNIIVSLQHLVSREADPLDSQVFFLLKISRVYKKNQISLLKCSEFESTPTVVRVRVGE